MLRTHSRLWLLGGVAVMSLLLLSCDQESTSGTKSDAVPSPKTAPVSEEKKLEAARLIGEASEKLRAGAVDSARQLFAKALEADPQNAAAKRGLAMPAIDPEKAQAAAALLQSGLGALKGNDLLGSHRLFMQARALDPYNFEASDKAAMTAWQVRRFDVSMEIADAMIELYPFDAEIRVKGAQAAYSAADFDRCLRYLHEGDTIIQANESLSTNASMWFMRGIAAKNQSLVPEAIDCFQRATRLEPRDSQYINHLGGAYLDDGQYDLAVRTFKELMERAPADAYAPYHIGIALDKQGEKLEAIEWYKKSLQRDNTNWNCCVKIARCYESAGGEENLKKAISYCDLALSKNELSHEAMFTLSAIYRKLGNVAEADRYQENYQTIIDVAKAQEERLRDLSKRLRENPNDIAARLEAIEIHVRFRHWEEAMDEVKKLLIIDPKNVEGLVHASRLAFVKNDFIACYWEAQKLVEYAPMDSRGYTLLASAAIKMDRTEEALRAAERGYECNSSDFGALEILLLAYSRKPGYEAKIAELRPRYEAMKKVEEDRIREAQRNYDAERERLLGEKKH